MQKYNLDYEITNIDGVYRIKIDLPFDVRFVCNYLIRTDDNKNILIDAGFNLPNWRKAFSSALEELNLSVKDIDYCIVTHEHVEHIGLLERFKKENPEMQILMHEITHENIQWQTNAENYEDVKKTAKDVAKQMIKYGVSEEQGKRIVDFFLIWSKLLPYQKPDIILKDLEEISCGTKEFKIIWVPGHSLGHICIFDKKKRHLFSGDHILSRITPHVGIFTKSPRLRENHNFDNILKLFLNSLEKVEELDPKIVFPGHQEVIYDVRKRIAAMKEHHQQRIKEITKLIENNPMTPIKISQVHFGEDLDEVNAYMAINEVISHLIYLEQQDKVKRIERDGKFYFST